MAAALFQASPPGGPKAKGDMSGDGAQALTPHRSGRPLRACLELLTPSSSIFYPSISPAVGHLSRSQISQARQLTQLDAETRVSSSATTCAATACNLTPPFKPPRPLLRSFSSGIAAALTDQSTSASFSSTVSSSALTSRTSSMSFFDGVSANSAADLLRQAMQSKRKRGTEEEHDQLGSGASTPPGAGVSTPRPDPTDKRSPGILHSYFGQVRLPFHKSTDSLQSTSCMTSAATMGSVTSKSELAAGHPNINYGLPTAPTSPTVLDGVDRSSPLLPHESLGVATEGSLPPQETHHAFPSPPNSPRSSIPSPRSGIIGPTAGQTHDEPATIQKLRPTQTHFEKFSAKIRRHSRASAPLSSVISTPSIHASHLSSPNRRRSEHKRLIESVALPRRQSTPPRTPRATSIDSKSSQTASPSVNASIAATIRGDERTGLHRENSNGSIVRPPKGRLSVTIAAGRGLKPSVDPYVVCKFQRNEYISKGPRSEGHRSSGDWDDKRLSGGIPMTRSDSGRPMAIPMSSRQSSHRSISEASPSRSGSLTTDPVWGHDATFDVVGEQSEIDISVYDHSEQERFLGHIRFSFGMIDVNTSLDEWFKLEPREAQEDQVSGEIHLRIRFQATDKRHYGPEDFQILKLIGKGTFGQVFQVRKRDTQRVYAMKVLSKKVIVQKKEVAHTLGERNILVRTAMTESPFIVGLKFSFQTPTDLYLVTDYMSGGELFWHLQKEGRFNEDRAKFYVAELILALQHLHIHDIVYRDLKPENILLDANGHIALCDFGLSKANLAKDDTTNTFCGTTEYLAPEVLLDEHGYTKMVDFWSLGVLVFEMCCGWSPFYAEDTQQMYKNIAFGKVRFPRDALSNEGRNFVKGLLNRNPKHRLGATNDAEELKAHPFFADVDWVALAKKNVVPPFKPRLKSVLDTSNFDPEFTTALQTAAGGSSLNTRAAALVNGVNTSQTPISPTMQANFKGFTFVDESAMDRNFQDHDAMDEDQGDDEDADWEKLSPQQSHDNRMSGIFHTGGADDRIDDNMGF